MDEKQKTKDITGQKGKMAEGNQSIESSNGKSTEEISDVKISAESVNIDQANAEAKQEAASTEQLKTEPLNAEAKQEEAKAQETETASRKPRKKHLMLWIILAVVVLVLAYVGVGVYYQTHFFPNTYINEIDCSQLKVQEVVIGLENQAQSYQLQVRGRNPKNAEENQVIGTLNAQDIQLSLIDTEEDVQYVLDQQEPFLWIIHLGKQTSYHDLVQGVAFDEELLETIVSDWDALQNRKTIAPENAYIGEYSEETKSYPVIPETLGTRLDKESVFTAISDTISMHAEELDLEEYGCYEVAAITAENKELLEEVEKANQWVASKITYDWNGTEVILDGDSIHQWITFEKNKPVLDEEAVRDFVAENAREHDTYGKKRKFTTTMGIELTLPSGAYGWKTDRDGETEELCGMIYSGTDIEKEPLYTSKGAQKGTEDIGSTYIEIDLTYQHLYLYEKGEIVLETDFVSGSMNIPRRVTPQGVFGLTYKTRNAVLRGEDYETPVSYWMPFNGNVGMHDATWRNSFGGTIYLTNGSHGCINLPLNMAAQIYEYVSTGFPIICYYY